MELFRYRKPISLMSWSKKFGILSLQKVLIEELTLQVEHLFKFNTKT